MPVFQEMELNAQDLKAALGPHGPEQAASSSHTSHREGNVSSNKAILLL